ncbi:MAG: glycosyltransferase family 39 protein [Anaerolineales bacterium]
MKDEIGIEEAAPWIVIAITLLGGVLRILLINKNGMWLDETFSVWLANHSLEEMLSWIAKIDQHPPLYYLLLHPWIGKFGDTPYYVRLLSVLFGTITIPVIYQIGKRMSGAMMGLVAALFLALSPFNIRFAQEARMYTLLTFNAAMAIYALVSLLTDVQNTRPIGSQFLDYLRAWREPRPVEPASSRDLSYQVQNRNQTRWRAWINRHNWQSIKTIETDLAWIGFIVFSAATMLTHNTAVFFPIATNTFVLGLMLYKRIKKPESMPGFQAPSMGNWIKAQIGIFLLWSPWLVVFIQQASRVYQEFWIPKPDMEMVIQTIESLFFGTLFSLSSQIRIIWILYAVLLFLGLMHFRKRISQFLFLASLFAIPLIGELVISIRRPIFYDRTLIWITIPLTLVLAAGVVQLRFRYLMIAVLGTMVTINLFFASDYYRFMRKEDWNTAAGYVANFAEEDDLVLFNANWVQIPFDYYFKTYERLYDIQVVKHGVPEDMFVSGVLEPKMTENDIPGLIALVDGQDRVWLVYSHNDYTDPMGLIPQTLESKMELSRQRDFFGGQVQLYETP